MKKQKIKSARISKRKKDLVRISDSPIIIGDLVSLHYHGARTTECECFDTRLDFRTSRMFFSLALRDLVDSNMNLKHREQNKIDNSLYTERS